MLVTTVAIRQHGVLSFLLPSPPPPPPPVLEFMDRLQEKRKNTRNKKSTIRQQARSCGPEGTNLGDDKLAPVPPGATKRHCQTTARYSSGIKGRNPHARYAHGSTQCLPLRAPEACVMPRFGQPGDDVHGSFGPRAIHPHNGIEPLT